MNKTSAPLSLSSASFSLSAAPLLSISHRRSSSRSPETGTPIHFLVGHCRLRSSLSLSLSLSRLCFFVSLSFTIHSQKPTELHIHANTWVLQIVRRHALNVRIFLKMHRSYYAEKQLRIMQQIDEDHTLTQLANAWLNLAVGGSKIQKAYLIFQDFSEKYQMTSLILNGKAMCCMHMGNFDEAESLLLEALNKDAKDLETLANLIVCSLHLGKPSSRFLNQLKLSHPDHMLVKRASSAEESFDRAIQTIA